MLRIADVYAERTILSLLVHPLVVRLNFSFEHERKLYLGMEYLQGGELYYHLKRCDEQLLHPEF